MLLELQKQLFIFNKKKKRFEGKEALAQLQSCAWNLCRSDLEKDCTLGNQRIYPIISLQNNEQKTEMRVTFFMAFL